MQDKIEEAVDKLVEAKSDRSSIYRFFDEQSIEPCLEFLEEFKSLIDRTSYEKAKDTLEGAFSAVGDAQKIVWEAVKNSNKLDDKFKHEFSKYMGESRIEEVKLARAGGTVIQCEACGEPIAVGEGIEVAASGVNTEDYDASDFDPTFDGYYHSKESCLNQMLKDVKSWV